MKAYYPAALLAATTMAVSAFAQTPRRERTRQRAATPSAARREALHLGHGRSAHDPDLGQIEGDPAGLSRRPRDRRRPGRQPCGSAGRAGRDAPGAAPAAPAPAAGPQASDGVADTEITLLSPTELFFLGKRTGSMNVVLQSTDGRCVVKDIIVTVDPDTLQAKLAELMPEETGIKVRGADTALVLTGNVSDAIKLDHVMSLATSYGDGKKVVNLLRINTPQQVMLEVKIAEVSKTLLDRFGLDFSRLVTSADGLTSASSPASSAAAPVCWGASGPTSRLALSGATQAATSPAVHPPRAPL